MSKTNKRSRSAEPSDVIPSKRAHHTSVVNVSQSMPIIEKFAERIRLVRNWIDRAGYHPIVHEFQKYYYRSSRHAHVSLIQSDIESMAYRTPGKFWEASERARLMCQAIELDAIEHLRVAEMDFSAMAAWACPKAKEERKQFRLILGRWPDSVSLVCELRCDVKEMRATLEVLDFKLSENIDAKMSSFTKHHSILYFGAGTEYARTLDSIYLTMGAVLEVCSSVSCYRPDMTIDSSGYVGAMRDTRFSLREEYLASEFPKMFDHSLLPVLIEVVRQYYGMGYVRPLNSMSEAAKQFDLEHDGVVSDDDEDLVSDDD